MCSLWAFTCQAPHAPVIFIYVVLIFFFFNLLHFEILERDISLDIFCFWILKQISDTRCSRACGLARWTLATLRVATRSVDEPDWLTPFGPKLEEAAAVIMQWQKTALTLAVRRSFVWSPIFTIKVTVMQSEATPRRTGKYSLRANGHQLQELCSPWWQLTQQCTKPRSNHNPHN